MTSERWAQIKHTLDLALHVPEAERAGWLARECGDDAELRHEVESLLNAHDDAGEFLEKPVIELEPAGAGERIGSYEVVREIGRGGMGTVFLARRADDAFEKLVAIKVIRQGLEHEFALRRFRNERQILANLEHPNIARLIDGGTTADGRPFIVMEYVEGEPLHIYCRTQSLTERQRLEIFLEACSAVQYAHRRLIVHRDLKPGNILVEASGTPKLLDFGIAKLLDAETGAGAPDTTILGFRAITPAYSSPEQLRGEPPTFQSDVYSLGIVLHEVLAGRRPELVEGAAQPAETGLPASLRSILWKAIRPAAKDRYESVEELTRDLRRYLDGVPVLAQGPLPSADWEPEWGSLAVLPFSPTDTSTTSEAYLGRGLTESLIAKLSHLGRLTVCPASAVIPYAAAPDPFQAGRELNAEYVLHGQTEIQPGRVRLTVDLAAVRTRTSIWSAGFEEETDNLLRLEDSLAAHLAEVLVPHLSVEERLQLGRRGTRSAKAYDAYLRGRWHWSRAAYLGPEFERALHCFREALEADPNYARAHAGLADHYLRLGVWGALPPAEAFASCREAAQRALELDSSLAEAHAALGFALWMQQGQTADASMELQLAITLSPEYANAHHWFGLVNSADGRHELAIASLERARRLDPRSPAIASNVGRCLYYARQHDRAIAELEQTRRNLGGDVFTLTMLAWCYLEVGRVKEARAVAVESAAQSGRNPFALCVLANAEAAAGDRAAAGALADEAESQHRDHYVSAYLRGLMHQAAGRRKEAAALMRQAETDQDPWRILQRPSSPKGAPVSRTPPMQARSRWRWVPATALFAAGLLAGYVVLSQLSNRPAPFQTTRITKITTNGTANRAAISRDGRRVAYTSAESGRTVLSIRPLDSMQATRLAGPLDGEVSALAFTGDGSRLSFVTYSRSEPARRSLFRVAAAGGPLERIAADLPGPASLSPDGASIAYFRQDAAAGRDDLFLRPAAGRAPKRVAAQNYPRRFSWPAGPVWSPDGLRIACAVEGTDAQGYSVSLVAIDVASGEMKVVPSPRWQYVEGVTWSSNGDALVVIGQEQDASFQQLWYVPYSRGKPRRLGSDLNDYQGVSLTADGQSLVSVQVQSLSNVYVLRRDDMTRTRQITPGAGRYFDLAWMPDGRILYASDTTGSADVWMMNADGSGQRPLTTGQGRSYSPAASPDGKLVAFHSNRGGNWNIWRLELATGETAQLTKGTRDSNWPQFTPDGGGIIYHHTAPNAMWNIWRVSPAGGEPAQLTQSLTTHPAVSPKDARIAAWYSENVADPQWKLAIFPPNGGEPLRTFSLPPTASPDLPVRWTPAGDAIGFLDVRDGVVNIWEQPVDGRPPRPITDFPLGTIYSFDWSKDGRLAYSRGMITSDVVLIHDERRK